VKLRRKTLIFVAVVFLCSTALLYAALHNFLLANFAALETRDVRLDVDRALAALSSEVSTLNALNDDWASWDDTYVFMQDANLQYIHSNLVDSTFTALQINFVLFIDPGGHITFGKGFDWRQGAEIPIPQSLTSRFSPGSPLLVHADPASSASGILMLPEGPLIVSARPILTSERQGPARGTLLMGRYLDATQTQHLATLTRLSLVILAYHDPQLPADFLAARTAFTSDRPVAVRTLSENSIAGYALLKDIYGEPALLLRVDMLREIYAQGQAATRYVVIILLAIDLTFAVLALALLERSLLSRLAHLSAAVAQIGKSKDISARITMSGKDELTTLAQSINEMLDSLAQSEEKRRQSEKALEVANAQLWLALEAKDQMIQNVSHELRTPLTIIHGYVELLEDSIFGPLTDDQQSALAMLTTQGNRLHYMVNRLLTLQTLDPGKLNLVEVDPAEVIQQAIRAWERHAIQDEVELCMAVSPDLPSVLADIGLLQQVIDNLIDNAIKFSPNGGAVTVAVWQSANQVVIAVADRGIGIASEKLEQVSERFYQVDGGSTRRFGGMGIGLALCRAIVEAHGGSIQIRSQGEGAGSAVYVLLPAATHPLPKPAQPDTALNVIPGYS
jgi:signal transduction histidine kinase